MQITVYTNFSKRVNSTKQPTVGTGTAVDVVLKDECTIISPTFILNKLDFDINYVEAFGNYYFAYVKNLDGHRSEIICTLDHLATFKTQIGSYTGFVEYASASSNVTIMDPRNKPTDIIAATPTNFTLSGVTFNNVGGYIIGVLSDNVTGDVGVIDYYTMTSLQMKAFSQELYNQNFIQRIQDQFQGVKDSLVSCIWLPMTGIGGGSTAIHIGRETMSATGGHVYDRVVSFSSGSTALNFATGSGGAGADMTYLEKAPYCTGIVYLPFIGFVPIDMDIAAYYKNMTIDGAVDILTGDIAYNIRYGGGKVSTYNGNCATKVPISAAGYDGIGVAAGAITAIGGVVGTIATIASGGAAAPAVAAGVGATAGGAMSMAKSAELHTMINGANSSALGARLGTSPFALILQNVPAETNLTSMRSEQGMPYFKTATLSSLGGYIQCSDASVNIPGDGEEQMAVNGYLNSGFYYE